MTKEELLLLDKLGIYDLRIKLREVGGTPGLKSKEILIKEIRSIVESGEKPVRSTRGRKAAKRLSDLKAQTKPQKQEDAPLTDFLSNPVFEDVALDGNHASGFFEFNGDGSGFLFQMNCEGVEKPVAQIPKHTVETLFLRRGDLIEGKVEMQGDEITLSSVSSVNGLFTSSRRREFERLTPTYPKEKIKLERVSEQNLVLRFIDLFCPIGKGQRGLVVAPKKNCAKELLKQIATSITENNPDVYLITLLLDGRPEEVAEMRESFKGEVVCTTFDQSPEYHVSVAEIILCRAKRLVELGQNVVVLADSLNSLVRAYNQTSPQNGKSTGGLENSALQSTKKFFGSARNLEEGGSLTIIATAYTDTDGVIYEEFKETCNMQLCINEEFEGQLLSNIDFTRSQTIKDGKILSEDEFNCSRSIRKFFNSKDAKDVFVKDFKEAPSNSEFVFDFLSKNK